MAKPILVVNYCIHGMSKDQIVRNLRELKTVLDNEEIKDQYFVFMLPVMGDSHVQVFYDKDFEKTKYEDLRNRLETKISELYG